MIETFFRPRKTLSRLFVAGVGCEDDTTSLLSDLGVFECSSILDQYNIPHPEGAVYAATHARAIADMVLITILDDGSPDFIRLDDWMPSDEDKQAVFDLLEVAMKKMNESDKDMVAGWIAKSRPALNEVERMRRERAVNFALGSVGLEGFTPSEEAQDQAQRFINGEITLQEFLKQYQKKPSITEDL